MPRYGYEPLAFTKETLTLPNTTTVEGFEREKQEEFCVHKGLDISGMCLRAFQI